MTTTAAVITQALKISGVLGIGQTASAEDTADALFQVNLIFGQWNRKRWLNTNLIDVSVTSTGARSYSVGTGGDIATARPDRLEAVFARKLVFANLLDGAGVPLLDGAGVNITDGGGDLGIDYPLYLVEAREEYNRIAMKGLSTWPGAAFYNSAYPLGELFVWPIPSAGVYEIHLSLKSGIAQVTDPAVALDLPDEYTDALLWTLATRLRPMYQLPPDPTATAAMRAALNTIRIANTQVPPLPLPGGLTAGRRGAGSNWAGFNSGWAA